MALRNDNGLVDTLSPWWSGPVAWIARILRINPLAPAGGEGGGEGMARSLSSHAGEGWGEGAPHDLDSIRALPWPAFARLIGEAFRQKGFSVEERGSADADGTIDLVLRRGGAVTIVQCNRWQEQRVGVEPIRELYGAMTGENASGALFITSGRFTAEATAFAQTKPIGLIDGPALLELVHAAEPAPAAANRGLHGAPTCHVCSRRMVQRIERRGLRREVFWACSGYPHCKGNRPLQEAA